MVQRQHFNKEIEILSKRVTPPHLRSLHPFIQDGLMHVGGRLENSNLDFLQKHPVLVPTCSPIVPLIITHCHEKNAHAGPSLDHSILRQKYWLLGARSTIRSRLRSCIVCFKVKPRAHTPIMGDLLACRVQEAKKAFGKTGVDCAGPFLVVPRRGRGVRPHKAYLCIFVCLLTKAIHLEVVSDMSTAAFLNPFRRFVARRGPCPEILTDNGTNFVGAKNQFAELYQLWSSDEYTKHFGDFLAESRITWKLNPPSAPHFGGIWERGVRSVKTHLQKVVGTRILTYEELNTVSTQTEAILNPRPLSVVGDDPSKLQPLTPAHFLQPLPLHTLPAKDVTEISEGRLTRPEILDSIVQCIWGRWRLEYLHTLQQRQRWRTSGAEIAVGQVVILVEENTPPLNWPLGIVDQTYPGADGVVNVKTAKGTYRRPVVKVCPLSK